MHDETHHMSASTGYVMCSSTPTDGFASSILSESLAFLMLERNNLDGFWDGKINNARFKAVNYKSQIQAAPSSVTDPTKIEAVVYK